MFSPVSVGDCRVTEGMLRHTGCRAQKPSLEALESLSVPPRALTKFPWDLGSSQRPEEAEAVVTPVAVSGNLASKQQSLLGKRVSVSSPGSNSGDLCSHLASGLHL